MAKKVLIQDNIICCWFFKPSLWSTEWNAVLEVKGPKQKTSPCHWPRSSGSRSLESSELKQLSWTVVFGSSPCSSVTAGAGPPARNKGWPGDQRLTATGNTGTLKNTFCFWKAIEAPAGCILYEAALKPTVRVKWLTKDNRLQQRYKKDDLPAIPGLGFAHRRRREENVAFFNCSAFTQRHWENPCIS